MFDDEDNLKGGKYQPSGLNQIPEVDEAHDQ